MLLQQLSALRNRNFKTLLTLNTSSIFGVRFWQSLVYPTAQDGHKLVLFGQMFADAGKQSLSESGYRGTILYLILFMVFWFAGQSASHTAAVTLSVNYLPEGRLRRSFAALATVAIMMLASLLSLHFLYLALFRTSVLSPLLQSFADGFFRLSVFCALAASMGKVLLFNDFPSWRLVFIDEATAAGMRYFCPSLIFCALASGTLELISNVTGISRDMSVSAGGVMSLLMAITMLILPWKVNHVRQNNAAVEGDKRSGIEGGIYLVTIITSLSGLLALSLGYIIFARFLLYQFIWIALVLTIFRFLSLFSDDVWGNVFSTSSASGLFFKKTMNLSDRNLEQITLIFTAACKCTLILLMVVALIYGTFGTTTPGTLLRRVMAILGGEGLKGLHIVPGNLFRALLCFFTGGYILRSTHFWLANKFLPKTISDTGIRASLLTLFNNVGYVLLILMTLSSLGIQWNNLAWIVSALSVGIGFGLQEIVKNFISGLILLTERPVKVGDMISISGVEGDVRRISVRATEIQLGDRSTVIVPNSQLISQNVRNATMGNAQGVITVALTFPTDVDPERVRALLLDVYGLHESILENPPPGVRFSQLGSEGITLSATGYIASPRNVGAVRSELLFSIFRELRKERITLSQPQKMLLMRKTND